MDAAGTTVLLLGLAREGQSLARYFQQQGARVLLTDAAPAERLQGRIHALGDGPELFLGRDYPELVARADRFFVSPGVPEWNPVYVAARDANLQIESMTTLFFDLCPAPIVGITGSSGKTTTTGLIGHILRRAGRDVLVGGNIGDPMLDLLPAVTSSSVVVLELSSFQLSILRHSPHIAVVTNITPNHLDRHGSMAEYIAAKRQIVAHQGSRDFAVLNACDPTAREFAAATPGTVRWFGNELGARDGAGGHGGSVGWFRAGRFTPILPIDDIPLLGRHNVENVLAAVAVAAILDVPAPDVSTGIREYRPSAHRLQVVGEREGVRYVDDSIATSPARATVALDAIEAPVVLIAGGRDKRLPWEEFARRVVAKARALMLIGEAAADIERAVRRALDEEPTCLLQADAIQTCTSLADAVMAATERACPGDVVLLSPACASYDMFTDFEERGAAFARAVESLHAA